MFLLLAGIAIFLLGMRMLEESLHQLAGRSFKLFLRKHTASPLKAIGSGALVTTVMQSSSIVNMLVLAFVGAGVLQLSNALAISIGANLGSTAANWVIVTIGFKLNLETIAYPLAGIAGILYALAPADTRMARWSKMIFGFGFLFIGLGMIRSGMENSMHRIDWALFDQYPSIVYLLIGFLITILLQSSSATMAIVLSALAAGAFGFEIAMAVVLGGEIGTTIKLLIASIGGSAVKKRLALGNFLYNTCLSFLFLLVLSPSARLITDTMGVKDPLIGLVIFQTGVNFIGIILVLPFLSAIGRFLEKRFTRTKEETLFIQKAGLSDPDLAIEALTKELHHFLLESIAFTRSMAELPRDPRIDQWFPPGHDRKAAVQHYDELKHLHGEIQSFQVQLQKGVTVKNGQAEKLERYIIVNRNTMYATKSIKDAALDMEQLRNSSNDIKFEFYRRTVDQADAYCREMTDLLLGENKEPAFEALVALYQSITKGYSAILQSLYKDHLFEHLNEIEISTLINFHREMYTGYKSFVYALKDLLLEEKESRYFEELPGFIR